MPSLYGASAKKLPAGLQFASENNPVLGGSYKRKEIARIKTNDGITEGDLRGRSGKGKTATYLHIRGSIILVFVESGTRGHGGEGGIVERATLRRSARGVTCGIGGHCGTAGK